MRALSKFLASHLQFYLNLTACVLIYCLNGQISNNNNNENPQFICLFLRQENLLHKFDMPLHKHNAISK